MILLMKVLTSSCQVCRGAHDWRVQLGPIFLLVDRQTDRQIAFILAR